MAELGAGRLHDRGGLLGISHIRHHEARRPLDAVGSRLTGRRSRFIATTCDDLGTGAQQSLRDRQTHPTTATGHHTDLSDEVHRRIRHVHSPFSPCTLTPTDLAVALPGGPPAAG